MITWNVAKLEKNAKIGWNDIKVYRTETRSYRIRAHNKGYYHMIVYQHNTDGSEMQQLYERWYMHLNEVEDHIMHDEAVPARAR